MFFYRLLAMAIFLAIAGCNSSNQSENQTEIKTPTETAKLEQDATAKAPASGAGENTLYMDVKSGRITIELLPDLAPGHVERIKALTRKGFYDGIVFHRVIDGFMAQTGDPTGTGRGGSELPDLKSEFSKTPFSRGVLGMARSQNPNSANSQFFIMFAQGDFLNGQYTVFGRVTDGMNHVDGIKKGDKASNGSVDNPDKIIKMQMASDS